MKTQLLFTAAALLCALTSCNFGGNTDQDHITRETAERDKKLDGNVVAFYKAVKLAVRAMPTGAPSEAKLSEEDAEALSSAARISAQVITAELDSTVPRPSVADYLEMLAKLSDAKEVANRVDEDEFPTVYEHAEHIFYGDDQSMKVGEILGWNNEVEHLVFWALLQKAPKLPGSWSLYEISKVEPEAMSASDMKACALLAQSFAYLSNDWPYLAESRATMSVDMLDNEEVVIYGTSLNWLEGTKLSGVEAMQVEWHAASVLTRAVCRLKMDDDAKRELAMQDLELFLQDCEKLGAENELVWLVGTIVSLHKNDREKAAEYLDKLATSDQLGDDERAVIAEAKQYLESSDPDAALRKITDNAFIAKVLVKYGYLKFRESEWYDQMAESKAGKVILAVPRKLDGMWSKVKSKMDVRETIGDLF